MVHRVKWALAGTALVALSGTAQAQSAQQQINMSSTVAAACGMGTPNTTIINLLDLTGPDGLLDPAKLGTAVLGTATIADAWCNGPNELSLVSSPMTLTRTVPYAQPSYMARHVTYSATLVGWGPGTVSIRPRFGGDTATYGLSQAQAAPASGLELRVSRLQTLTGADRTETPNLMLEHGTYRGTVTIRMQAN